MGLKEESLYVNLLDGVLKLFFMGRPFVNLAHNTAGNRPPPMAPFPPSALPTSSYCFCLNGSKTAVTPPRIISALQARRQGRTMDYDN